MTMTDDYGWEDHDWEPWLDDDPEPAEHDPGPEVDDEGGMSEYRFTGPWLGDEAGFVHVAAAGALSFVTLLAVLAIAAHPLTLVGALVVPALVVVAVVALLGRLAGHAGRNGLPGRDARHGAGPAGGSCPTCGAGHGGPGWTRRPW